MRVEDRGARWRNEKPYRGAAPAANDLAGGHVDTMFCDLGTVLPLHQGGRVRIIAATLMTVALIASRRMNREKVR